MVTTKIGDDGDVQALVWFWYCFRFVSDGLDIIEFVGIYGFGISWGSICYYGIGGYAIGLEVVCEILVTIE